MADRKNFFFEQRVTQAELDDAFADTENAEFKIKLDAFSGVGFLMALGTVTEDSPQSTSVLVGSFLGWDNLGQRVEKATGPSAFSFAGDDDPVLVTPARLYIKFARATSDTRTDGNGNLVDFEVEESFVIERDLGTPGGALPALRVDESIQIATVNIPAAAAVITNADITADATTQNLQSEFPFERIKGSDKNLEDALLAAKTAGAASGDRIAILSDITVTTDRFAQGYMGERKILTDRTVPTTRIEVEFCKCADKTNTRIISLANVVLDATTVGVANGLDAGALAPNTWYYIFAIKDSNDVNPDATLLSLNADAPFGGAPTLPGTHDLSRRIGSVRTDGASQFINFRQINSEVYYEEWAQALVSSGVPPGGITLVSMASRVPPTAERAWVHCYVSFAASGTGEGIRFFDGGRESGSNPPTLGLTHNSNRMRFVGGANAFSNAEFAIHVGASQEIFIQSSGANVNGHNIYVRGYVDDSKEG